jgi:histidinol-phosphate aminotransferase
MSYFRRHIDALDGYVPGEQPTDPTVTKLNTNENPYPPSPKVIEAIQAITPDQLRRYPDPLGNRFRTAAAEVFDVSPDMIICGNGMDDILNLAVRAFSGPEATLVYPTPTYSLYAVLANIEASLVKEVNFPEGYALPVDELVDADGRVTFVANPNAPSGTLAPVEQMADLADRLKGVLVVDEAYVDFADRTCMPLVKQYDNVLVFRTMSKGYSLAGVRFGFGVGSEPLIAGLMKVKDSYNVDALSVAAAAAAIRDQNYARAGWEKVRAERARLTPALERLGLGVLPSHANFLLARHPAAKMLFNDLKARKILVRYFDHPRLADRLRITIGTPEQNDILLQALGDIMATQNQAGASRG